MKKYIFLLLFMDISSIILAQDISIIRKQITSSSFVDCYPYKEGLVALSFTGKLYQVGLPDLSSTILSANSFSAMGVDKNGMLWASDSNSSYFSLRDTGWKWEGAVAARRIWEISFDSKNDLFLMTDLGIYNRKTEMFYGINRYRKYYSNAFARSAFRPNCFYMDNDDKLWIGVNGRIGKEVHVFSTKKNEFITSKMKGFRWLSYIQGIFGFEHNVFLVDLDMYGMSRIFTYRKDSMRAIHHPEYDTMNFGPIKEKEEYIGAAFFDKDSKEIYYYSSQGLLKAKYKAKQGKLENPELIMPAQCDWTGYEFESDMFVRRLKKMFKYHQQIVYLHKEQGIFIYDGHLLYNLL